MASARPGGQTEDGTDVDPFSDNVAPFAEELAEARTKAENFKADSALLKELGERLVGKPFIALAELVKNAYDADATACEITITAQRIIVADNGHGMSKSDFLDHWMTIGTRNKELQGFSSYFERPVTGSKGVGRLAAQFLAHRMQLLTTAKSGSSERLHAFVDWGQGNRLRLADERYGTLARREGRPRVLSSPFAQRYRRSDGRSEAAVDSRRSKGAGTPSLDVEFACPELRQAVDA